MMLLLPEWDRTCADCRRWVHDDGDGVKPERKGLPMVSRDGERLPRAAHVPTPCYKCPKIPNSIRQFVESKNERVTHVHANEPEPWHREVVSMIAECHAVGQYPRTPWVRKWAAMVRPYILAAENRPSRELVGLLSMHLASSRR